MTLRIILGKPVLYRHPSRALPVQNSWNAPFLEIIRYARHPYCYILNILMLL